jgi:hypothetical protein
MFSIKLIPSDVLKGSDGERLGEIVIGSYSERFPVYWRRREDPRVIEAEWTALLQQLIEGKSAVALRTDPRFAWVLYRDSQEVHVQQQCLVPGWDGSLSPDGIIESLPTRRIVTEHGEPISEWHTTIDDIKDFLNGTVTV